MTHKGTITLKTERLILRRFVTSDAEAMFLNFFNDPVAVAYSRWKPHENIEDTRELISQYINEYENYDVYNWAIVKQDINEPIGRIAVSHLDERVSTANMSFFIGRAFWHNGYASEALTEVIRYLFEKVGLNRIEGRHDVANTNSGCVMKKCGMHFEGILRQAGKNSYGFVDVGQYGIIAQDYICKTKKPYKLMSLKHRST